MQSKIKTTYKHSSDSNLLKLAHRIAQNIKSNPDLPNPTPAQPVIETASQEFQTALSLAGRNDRTLSSAKNDKKAVLIGLLDELAKYVTTVANGNKTILLSSGFDITGIKGDQQELQPIDSFEVEIGPPGQAITRVKKVIGAKGYVHEYTPDPLTSDSVWTSEFITEREHTFTNLKSVVKYLFRVTAVGPNKQKAYSPIVYRVIQ